MIAKRNITCPDPRPAMIFKDFWIPEARLKCEMKEGSIWKGSSLEPEWLVGCTRTCVGWHHVTAFCDPLRTLSKCLISGSLFTLTGGHSQQTWPHVLDEILEDLWWTVARVIRVFSPVQGHQCRFRHPQSLDEHACWAVTQLNLTSLVMRHRQAAHETDLKRLLSNDPHPIKR
jgi:hypothetical protein